MSSDDGAAPEPHRRRPADDWVEALYDDSDRRAWNDFGRRSWQRHPVLSALRLACAVGAGLAAVAAGFDGAPNGLGWLVPTLLAGSFAFWVMLIRRDED